MPEDFFSFRDRAYDLADTGRYKDWKQVSSALLAEGFLAEHVSRLDGDRLAVMMIERCCGQARAGT
jgi:hypothetical protein